MKIKQENGKTKLRASYGLRSTESPTPPFPCDVKMKFY